MHSVNPYKVDQPIGYRTCHDTNVIQLWGHHIAALLPPSVLRFTSQQRSLAISISVSLPKWPFGAPASETTSAGHAYQPCHLTNGEANQRAELRIKGSHISEPVHSSFNAHPTSDTSRRAVNSQTYQEGGNYVRPPGHDASWTGHCITQQHTLNASTLPQHIISKTLNKWLNTVWPKD
jgi:hypothetical protein